MIEGPDDGDGLRVIISFVTVNSHQPLCIHAHVWPGIWLSI